MAKFMTWNVVHWQTILRKVPWSSIIQGLNKPSLLHQTTRCLSPSFCHWSDYSETSEKGHFGRRPYNPNTSLFPIYKNYSLSGLVITVSTISIYSGVATTGPIRAANFWRTLFKLSLWTMLFANELRMYDWVELYHEPTNYWGATRWAFIHHQTRCC